MSKYKNNTSVAVKIAAGLAVLLAVSAVFTCGIIFGGWFQSEGSSTGITDNTDSTDNGAQTTAATVSITEDTGEEVWNCVLTDGAAVDGWLFSSADGAATEDYSVKLSGYSSEEETYNVTSITFELNADSAIYTTYAELFTVTESTITMYDGAFRYTFEDIVQAFFGTTEFSTEQLAALQALADSKEATINVTAVITGETSGDTYTLSNEFYLYPIALMYSGAEETDSELTEV